MALQSMLLSGTTDGSGDLTVNGSAVYGWLEEIEWVQGSLAATTDVTITIQGRQGGVAKTVLTLTNQTASNTFKVRHAVHDNAGAAITGLYERVVLDGKPRMVIAQGGATAEAKCILHFFADR